MLHRVVLRRVGLGAAAAAAAITAATVTVASCAGTTTDDRELDRVRTLIAELNRTLDSLERTGTVGSTSANANASGQKRRIACVGDSITWGFDAARAPASAEGQKASMPDLAEALCLMSDRRRECASVPWHQMAEIAWRALGAPGDETPLKKRIARMARREGVETGWGAPWPANEVMPPRISNPYPAQLEQRLQRRGVDVRCGNFGMPGTTLSDFSHNPWTDADRQCYRDALAFAPTDVVVILGINDTGDFNWCKPAAPERFVESAVAMARRFQALPTKPRIIFALPPRHLRSAESDANRAHPQHGLDTCIRKAASRVGAELIDLRSLRGMAACCEDDGLHPDDQGATLIAEAVAAKF